MLVNHHFRCFVDILNRIIHLIIFHIDFSANLQFVNQCWYPMSIKTYLNEWNESYACSWWTIPLIIGYKCLLRKMKCVVSPPAIGMIEIVGNVTFTIICIQMFYIFIFIHCVDNGSSGWCKQSLASNCKHTWQFRTKETIGNFNSIYSLQLSELKVVCKCRGIVFKDESHLQEFST